MPKGKYMSIDEAMLFTKRKAADGKSELISTLRRIGAKVSRKRKNDVD